MRTGFCNWQRGIPNPRLPNPTPALLSLRALPLFRERLWRLCCSGEARDPRRPPLWLGAQRASWPPATAKGKGSRRGRPPAPRARPGPRSPRPASRVPSPLRALTLRRASGGGNGVPGPEGAQQRAQGCRTAGAPPATAAHPAGGPQSGAGAAGRRRRGGTGTRAGGGAATRGRPLRRAGTPRGAAVTLTRPEPQPGPGERQREWRPQRRARGLPGTP